eukprot:jgi/Tetstr1/421807/TSEL_012709.t1
MPDEATGRPPWRALLLAGGLLLGGATLLIMGAVEMACCPQAHWAAMLFLGALAFVPGFYHSRIAYLAARGARGYSFDQLRETNKAKPLGASATPSVWLDLCGFKGGGDSAGSPSLARIMLGIPGAPEAMGRLSLSEVEPPQPVPAGSVSAVSAEARLGPGAAFLAAAPAAGLLAWSDGAAAAVGVLGAGAATLSQPLGLPPGGGPVAALAFSPAGAAAPALLVLAGDTASVYGVNRPAPGAPPAGSMLGCWPERGGLAWRTAAWHPAEPLFAALSQGCLLLGAPQGDKLPEEAPTFAPPGPASGPLALAWTVSGTSLAVHWGGALELLCWCAGGGASGPASAATRQLATRRRLLLGVPDQLRALAAGPRGAILGTSDAPLALGSCASLNPIAAPAPRAPPGPPAPGAEALHAPGSPPGGVIDLRGRFPVEAVSVEAAAGPAIPPGLLLHSGGAAAAGVAAPKRAARLLVVWPPQPGDELMDDGVVEGGAQVAANNVLPLPLPMPDILRTCGSLAAVASSSAPPVVLLFQLTPEGLVPLSKLLLSSQPDRGVPEAGGDHSAAAARLRGLVLWRGDGAQRGTLFLRALQGRQKVEYAPFTTPSMALSLSLTSHAVELERTGAVLSPTAPPPRAAGAAPAAQADPPAPPPQPQGGSAAGADTSELAGLIMGLQAHLDSRLDRVEGCLAMHEDRLVAIEQRMAASSRGPKKG